MHRFMRRGFALVLVAALACLAAASQASAAVFSNPAPITIPDSGTADPYPSTINVSDLAGTITDVNVTLNGLSHTFIDDIGVLLVGPTGENVVLMQWTGSGNSPSSTLTFDDAAAASLPFIGPLPTGTYKPTCFNPLCALRVFSPPAPAQPPPYGSALSVVNDTDANGTWSLYVQDFLAGDVGSISGGWSLDITTPGTEIGDLQDLVASMGIHHGITNALESKLQHALDALAADDTAGACFWMQSFVDLVNAQTGKKISSDDAEQLIDAATEIRTQLDC